VELPLLTQLSLELQLQLEPSLIHIPFLLSLALELAVFALFKWHLQVDGLLAPPYDLYKLELLLHHQELTAKLHLDLPFVLF